MKSLLGFGFILILVLSNPSQANESYEEHWKTINQDLILKGCVGCSYATNPVQKEECGFASCEKVCYDRSGKDIGDERCNKIWDWALNGSKAAKAQSDIDKVSNDIKLNLKEYYSHVQAKLAKNAAKGSDQKNESIKAKMKSKECQIYRLEVDICQKSQLVAAVDAGVAMEEESTKQSGIVNKFSRYKLGQMKAMHGTGQIPKLKTKYKQLKGSDWTPKVCEFTNEEEGAEEIRACGCIKEGNFADCPLN